MRDAPRQIVAASASERSGDAPAGWHDAAARRLVLVSAVATALGVLALPMLALRQENVGALAGYERPAWLVPLFALVSATMLAIARSERIDARRKLDAGIAYLIVLAAIAALFRHALPYTDADVVRGFSPIVPGIVFFAVVVPVNPTRVLVAATLAALCDPLGLVFWIVTKGFPTPPWNLWVWLFAPTFVSVGLGVVVARLLFSLGKEIERAQKAGRYRLVSLLGRGGMGEVWRAEHDTLARPAAIKLIRPDVLGHAEERDRARARFEREAQATAQLTSPHTIELYDFGVTDEGVFFYVMELLDGLDLGQVLERSGALPPSRAVFLLEQVCHSLRDAHRADFVHRDVKPANIYVCRKGADVDVVKVLDFGLAKRASGEAVDLTQADGLAGTPRTMAPETIAGEDPGFGADVYALGCVAYRMLTGRDVFEAPTVMGILMKHVQDTPIPIGDAADQAIPGDLGQLVMRCLDKDPSARPADAGELLDALRRTRLSLEWTQEDARAWWDAHGPPPLDLTQAPKPDAADPTAVAPRFSDVGLDATEAAGPALAQTVPAQPQPSDDETLAG